MKYVRQKLGRETSMRIWECEENLHSAEKNEVAWRMKYAARRMK